MSRNRSSVNRGSATAAYRQANVVFRSLLPDEFAAFHEPGYVKIAWTLRARQDAGTVTSPSVSPSTSGLSCHW